MSGKRRGRSSCSISALRRLQKQLEDLQIKMNELEGIGRCIEGELEMLRELSKEEGGGEEWGKEGK
jgi:hypothetical protein